VLDFFEETLDALLQAVSILIVGTSILCDASRGITASTSSAASWCGRRHCRRPAMRQMPKTLDQGLAWVASCTCPAVKIIAVVGHPRKLATSCGFVSHP
jgi:hypothetical protein